MKATTHGWLLVCFFTLLFDCFSLLFIRKAPGSKGEGSSNESSMFCNDCTPVWGKSCTILIVRIINKEIPKGAPQFWANRYLGSCVGAVLAKLNILPPFIFVKIGYSGIRASSHHLSQEGERAACWSKYCTKMSQSEEEYEYGHSTENEEHSQEKEVSLEELEEEANERGRSTRSCDFSGGSRRRT